LQLTNSVSKTSKTKVVAIFSGTNYYYYYYYVVVKGRHSNWLTIANKEEVECMSPGGWQKGQRERENNVKKKKKFVIARLLMMMG
jgi:hypothetical protein